MSWPYRSSEQTKASMAAAKERGVKIGRPKAAVCKRGHQGAPRNKSGACVKCEKDRLAESYVERREIILTRTRELQTEQRRAAGVPVRRDGQDPEKVAVNRNANAALRRARKLQQTPPWADLKKIKELYKVSRQMHKDLGVRMAVDHIIPLKGEVVSGLHVHENLRVIPLSENAKKYNNYQCT